LVLLGVVQHLDQSDDVGVVDPLQHRNLQRAAIRKPRSSSSHTPELNSDVPSHPIQTKSDPQA
jgi:hypothetical protein